MKIHSVDVFDPRDYGLFERPIISITLEQELYPNSDAVTYFGNGKPGAEEWTTQRFGPFVKYSCTQSSKNYAGYYNRALSDHYPPIVDVRIHVRTKTGAHVIQQGNFALPLKRARQLLRQHNVPWRLLMNDHDGQKGLASWTPVRRDLRCKFMICRSDDQTCEDPAHTTVYTQGIDFPLCEEHLSMHNEQQKSARQSSR